MSDLIYCGHCGAEMDYDSDACWSCGNRLEEVGWTVRDEDEAATDEADWDEGTDNDIAEELPCVHADGCPGWERCKACYDFDEVPA